MDGEKAWFSINHLILSDCTRVRVEHTFYAADCKSLVPRVAGTRQHLVTLHSSPLFFSTLLLENTFSS
jgi:hypothetical protein